MPTSPAEDRDTLAPEDDPAVTHAVQSPPQTFLGTLAQLGPGLVIAGSIVGSGELIATTKTGAQAGISLLWLIVVGCLIKVFVQIELGRHTITRGETTLSALNQFPGRLGPVNWILWFWLLMMAASMAQLGGIVGGVGEALSLTFPITGDYKEAIRRSGFRRSWNGISAGALIWDRERQNFCSSTRNNNNGSARVSSDCACSSNSSDHAGQTCCCASAVVRKSSIPGPGMTATGPSPSAWSPSPCSTMANTTPFRISPQPLSSPLPSSPSGTSSRSSSPSNGA